MSAPRRPALRYFGGKWRLAPKIIAHFPPHRIYVEPFGGAASVLLRKPRSHAEIYNDLDGDVVNLFRVLQDPALSAQLVELVALTPFAREEFEASYMSCVEQVERARRLVIRSFMGHGTTASNINRSTGFRANATRNGTTPARDWSNLPDALGDIVRRIQTGVTIERRPAVSVIERFDGPSTLIYADPPYVHATRSTKRIRGELYSAYAVEMSDADHEALLDCLCSVQGMVVLSGYATDLYERRLTGWKRVEVAAHADGALDRTEVLWINPAAVAASQLASAA